MASGYSVIFELKADTDKILKPAATNDLKKPNLAVRIPPEIKAHRSIVCRKIDASVGECSPEDIQNELQQKQPWLRIRELIKFKTYTHMFSK